MGVGVEVEAGVGKSGPPSHQKRSEGEEGSMPRRVFSCEGSLAKELHGRKTARRKREGGRGRETSSRNLAHSPASC